MQPTEKQINLLQRFKVLPGPTRSTCSRLIDYVLYGNKDGCQQTKTERADLLRSVQDEYVGKTLSDKISARQGSILYVLPKTREEIRHELHAEIGLGLKRRPLPFLLCVEFFVRRERRTLLINIGDWEITRPPLVPTGAE